MNDINHLLDTLWTYTRAWLFREIGGSPPEREVNSRPPAGQQPKR